MEKISKKEAQQQAEARERVGLPKDNGKSYKDYVKSAVNRPGATDRVYKDFLDKKYRMKNDNCESLETLQQKELSK